MSRILYDHLNESILFRDDLITARFAAIPEPELQRALRAYREHVGARLQDLVQEATASSIELSAYAEGRVGFLMSENALKRATLYLERLVLGDPLFPLTWEESRAGKSMRPLLGFAEERALDRGKISAACAYMKRVTPLVAGGFLKFVPASRVSEPRPSVPLILPVNLNADLLPRSVLVWLHKHAVVQTAQRTEAGWQIIDDEAGKEIAPARCLVIDFPGLLEEEKGFIFHLHDAEHFEVDEASGRFRALLTLPDEPPEASRFAAWAFQSLNSAAYDLYSDLVTDVARAAQLQARYMTGSPVVAELLDHELEPEERRPDLKSDVAGLALQLEIPVVEGASFEALMEARSNYGDAFAAFRVALEKELRGLRNTTDQALLRRQLENAAHQLGEVEVAEATRSLGRLRAKLFGEATVFAASLAATVAVSPFSILGAIGAAVKGVSSVADYREVVRRSAGYFLLRVKKS